MENTNTNESVELEEQGQQEEQTTPKTYTEEELLAFVQRESDKRVTSALKKQAASYEKKLSLSKLDENSRAAAEKDMLIQELQGKLAEFEIEKNRSELKTVLSSRGLSAEFADLIHVGEDIEEAQSRIDRLDKLFKAAVNEEVKRRIGSSTPSVGTSEPKALDKAAFKKLSLAEKNKLYTENPELFNSFAD